MCTQEEKKIRKEKINLLMPEINTQITKEDIK